MRKALLAITAALLLAGCAPGANGGYSKEVLDARGPGPIVLTERQKELFEMWANGGPHGMQAPRYFFVGTNSPFVMWWYCDHAYCNFDMPVSVSKKSCDARAAERYGEGEKCRLFAIEGEIVRVKN